MPQDQIKQITKRINALIKNGTPMAEQFDSRNLSSEQAGKVIEWRTQTINFLDSLLPLSGIYLAEFKRKTDLSRVNPLRFLGYSEFNLYGAVGILKGLKEDISSGYTNRFNDLIAAGVFNNFIEMSEHLCEKGYLESATSLSTAVLEEGLRHIAKNNPHIPVEDKDTLGPLNDKCAKAGVYSELWSGKIAGWTNGPRNDIDHGKFPKFKKNYRKKDIKEMIDGIKQFLAAHTPQVPPF